MSATQALEDRVVRDRAPKEIMEWESLERQDWHLWILNILLILVLGVSLLGFMFPAAFWIAQSSQANLSQRAFFGFCALLGLVLIYLLQRQSAIRHLKNSLYSARAKLAAVERESTMEVFRTLPNTAQFRDTLAMEFRRASTAGTTLSGIVIKLANTSVEDIGNLAKNVRAMLRQGESMYRISNSAMGVILPKMQMTEMRFFAGQLEDVGKKSDVQLELSTTSYPEEASSLSEMETRLRGL